MPTYYLNVVFETLLVSYSELNSETCCFEFLMGSLKIQEDCSSMKVPCFPYDFRDFFGISSLEQSLMLASLPSTHASSPKMDPPCTAWSKDYFEELIDLLSASAASSSSNSYLSVGH